MEGIQKERLLTVDDLIRVAIVSPNNRVVVSRELESGKSELYVITVEPLEDADKIEPTHSQPTL